MSIETDNIVITITQIHVNIRLRWPDGEIQYLEYKQWFLVRANQINQTTRRSKVRSKAQGRDGMKVAAELRELWEGRGWVVDDYVIGDLKIAHLGVHDINSDSMRAAFKRVRMTPPKEANRQPIAPESSR